MIVLLYSTLVNLYHLISCVLSLLERHRGAIECPEKGNRESLGERLEQKSDKEQLRDLGCAQSGEKELKGNLLALYKSLAGWWSQLEIDLFSQVTSDKIRGNGLQLH